MNAREYLALLVLVLVAFGGVVLSPEITGASVADPKGEKLGKSLGVQAYDLVKHSENQKEACSYTCQDLCPRQTRLVNRRQAASSCVPTCRAYCRYLVSKR